MRPILRKTGDSAERQGSCLTGVVTCTAWRAGLERGSLAVPLTRLSQDPFHSSDGSLSQEMGSSYSSCEFLGFSSINNLTLDNASQAKCH